MIQNVLGRCIYKATIKNTVRGQVAILTAKKKTVLGKLDVVKSRSMEKDQLIQCITIKFYSLTKIVS